MSSNSIYSLSLCGRLTLDLHALNNEGTEGNQMLTRQVTIVDDTGTLHTVNAISGDMMKHIQAEHLLYAALADNLPVSAPCRRLDPNRIAADREFIKRLSGKKDAEEGAGGIREKCWDCWTASTPLRIVVGVLLMCLSILIVLSLAMSSVDKLMHSTCKYSCAYSIPKPTLPNPIDLMLGEFSKAFPIDFLVFGGLTCYMFVCALNGLVNLGVRLFVFRIYEIRAKHSMPSALLMGCWMLMFVALALNMEVLTLSPQYATFGNQFYANITMSGGPTPIIQVTKEKCTIELSDTNGQCIMSQVGRFIHLIDLQLPFFGVVLFFANLLFIAAYLLFLTRELFCPANPDSDYHALKDDQFFGEDP